MVERLDFESRRRVFEAFVGLVAMRLFGRTEALRKSSTSFCWAVARLRSCERCSCDVMISIPSRDNCLPAMVPKRCFSSSGRPEFATSKRNSTAVDTLFTFCPPGPEARMNVSEMSRSSMLMEFEIRIMLSRFKRLSG